MELGKNKRSRDVYEELDRGDLSDEQFAVAKAVLRGSRNVFCTGSAGCGKSYLLDWIRRRSGPLSTYVTAPTGLAALNIHGTTIHRFAGIWNPNIENVRFLVRNIRDKNPGAVERWCQCRLLIIDEVSMMSGALLEMLDQIARLMRPNHFDQPFGGIQVFLLGDFCQLPPVRRHTGNKELDKEYDFCFQNPVWASLRLQVMQLTQPFRQKDPAFMTILNELRMARLSFDSCQTLRSRVQRPAEGCAIEPTALRPTNGQVDTENQRRLDALPGERYTFEAEDSGRKPELMKQCPVPQTLSLKVGACVILLKNVDPEAGLVNGTRGIVQRVNADRSVVVDFERVGLYTVERQEWSVAENEVVLATRTQIPLRLGWVLTIHKCQGMTLDTISVSTQRMFEYGQMYVALSRAKTLDGVFMLDFYSTRAKVHPDVKRFYESLAVGGDNN